MIGVARGIRRVALLAIVAGPLAAQTPAMSDSALQAQTRALSSVLRCPVCQGESIQDSPSELSAQMRELVRDQLRAGKSPDEVKQYFVDRYGEWILLEPKPKGANLLLYVFPFLAIAGGLLFVSRVVKRWTAPIVVADEGSARPTEPPADR
ncbi:MAG: cytochrome c-type biogenesis protein [Gemmatimonadaceae bacterium]